MPKLSLIVPIYNVAPWLCRCLDSLLAQSVEEIEIIAVNDGSTDESPSLCDAWAEKDSRVRVIHKKNEGLGMARNTGIEAAALCTNAFWKKGRRSRTRLMPFPGCSSWVFSTTGNMPRHTWSLPQNARVAA